MTDDGPPRSPPLCPSAQPEMEGSVVFGVADGPRVSYLAAPIATSVEVLALAGPVPPTEVFRFAAPCAPGGCRHFDGAACRLAERIVQLLPPAVAGVPPCPIRPDCRWWQQEGKAACLRCPTIV